MDEQAIPEKNETRETLSQKNEKGLKSNIPEVIAVRGWKEYVGESLLIVFSVGLALILTELLSRSNEKKHVRELIAGVREELVHNESEVKKQYDYHLGVLNKIDSALTHPAFANQLLTNNEFHLELIADSGLLHGDIEDVAWQLARSSNINSQLDIQTIGLLTSIYKDQERIIKVEDEIGKVLLSADSRKPENLRITLLLVRDNYRGWATYRVPDLLNKYDRAIAKLAE